MGKPIEVTRMDVSALALQKLAGRTRNGAVVRHLLGMALIQGDYPRAVAAISAGGQRRWRSRERRPAPNLYICWWTALD